MDTTTRGIAEDLLLILRRLNQADDQKLARDPGPYGHTRHALITILETADWGPAHANEAILHAMQEGSTLFDAMLATRVGECGTANVATPVNAPLSEISDELAQQIANAIGEHFGADRDYWPQVMDADWDSGGGRVIVWMDGLPDWAFLACDGGTSDYAPIEYASLPLPAGVWAEVINPQALRILPNPR
ncbi:hypothetical protein HNP84_002491 [Thermocatellispora tengchongensis]|uniref:Uncharacterized protein n=1 Tax=Thermocatellispora tengchongensis TaxID=1073253 RepID=A0A840P5M0_9ACTN|nr:hypothetical protein [Thermocatellispora tengchongensis]MBB5132770.1 hypothetical protein [Thermocatellispora tengchongensis]